VIVRCATTADVEAIAQIVAVVAEEGMLGAEAPVDVAGRSHSFREWLEEGGGVIYVLDQDGEVVGHLAARESTSGVLRLAMAVLPPARGLGGGRMLLERLIEHGRLVGAHKLELEVWVENGRAIALYSRNGFEIEGIRREHYRRRDGSLRSSMLMARRLDRA
jgi:ribosomal protein S18 acetylase RimI-like enzyme